MPFRSQAQWGWAFATGQPFADRWAKETPGGKGKRFRRLPRKKKATDATAPAVAPPHGPGGLLATPGVGGRRARALKRRCKNTKIVGNLYRANDGKFTAGSGGDSAESAPAADEPKQPSARSQNAAARRERATAEAEARAGEDDAEQATRDEEDAKLDAAKTPRQRAALRREIAKARRERAAELRKARAERSAAERSKRTDEDSAAADEAAQPKAPKTAKPKDPKAEKPKKGGGGGGKKDEPKKEDPEKAAAAEAKKREQDTKRAELEARRAEAEQRRAAADEKRAAAESARQERTQRELTDLAQRAQTPGMRLTDTEWQRLVVEGLAQRDGAMIRLSPAGEAQARRQPQSTKGAPVFLTFKDARGADRWLSITTTAYEDRDAEIITTKGIAFAVGYGDATGERGTLRYWHVPGLDLGACDYQAQGGPGGRWLIESGTFYGPQEAAVGRAMALKGWHMSPGFLHPQGEPYAAEVGGRRVGLFDHPMLFERSPTPPGRASNLFGRISVKETRMNEEKRAALKELVGGDDKLMADLLSRIEQTDKAAQTAGVAFKDAPEWAMQLVGLIEQQGARLAALEATQKAAPPAEDPAIADMAMAAEDEASPADAEEDAAEGEDNLLSQGEIQAIADAVAATLMGKIEELSGRMAAVDEELKGRGYQRMKEFPAALDTLTATVKSIEATVKALNGDAPARRHQGSRDNPDLSPDLAAALKGEAPDSDPYASVMRFLRPAQ